MSDEQRSIAGTIDITLNLTDKRGIKISRYIYSDDSVDDINLNVDIAQDILDRQHVRADIVTKEAEKNQLIKSIDQIAWNYETLTKIKEGGKKLTTVQMDNLRNCQPQIDFCKKQIESLDAAIAEAKKKLAA